VKNIAHSRPRPGLIGLLLLTAVLAACTSGLDTRVSGNLGRLKPEQTVAILPVETVGKGDSASGRLLRKSLHANLMETPYRILEPYVVDSLLRKNGMTNPATYSAINPMEFGEALGVDAVLISRLNHVERSYLLLHSSIELSVSLQMVDTRTGEILWRADQTESDYQGIGKIPTGILSALVSPIYFVTNKFNLSHMTAKVAEDITKTVRKPELAKKEKVFRRPLVAAASLESLEQIRQKEKTRTEEERAETMLVESPFRMLEPVSQIAAGPLPHSMPLPESAPETKKPAPPAARPALVKAEPAYTIQVGAYRDQDAAVKVVRALAKKGYRAFIVPATEGGKTLYRVHVERFERREEAVELAEKLRRRENMRNFVTRVQSG